MARRPRVGQVVNLRPIVNRPPRLSFGVNDLQNWFLESEDRRGLVTSSPVRLPVLPGCHPRVSCGVITRKMVSGERDTTGHSPTGAQSPVDRAKGQAPTNPFGPAYLDALAAIAFALGLRRSSPNAPSKPAAVSSAPA